MSDDHTKPETATTTAEAPSESPEITITRLFDAPPKLVFEAFTDADVLEEWWGPDGFTTTTKRFAFEESGIWELVMHGPDGTDYPNYIEFLDILEPERIVYQNGSSAQHPDGFENTITLVEDDGKTLLTMRMVFPTVRDRDASVEHGAVEGGRQTLARLARYLENGERV